MDTRTGQIRILEDGEQPKPGEIAITNRQARRLQMLSTADRVEWAARVLSDNSERSRRKRMRKLQRAARKAQR